jgi:hypothetical protein
MEKNITTLEDRIELKTLDRIYATEVSISFLDTGPTCSGVQKKIHKKIKKGLNFHLVFGSM